MIAAGGGSGGGRGALSAHPADVLIREVIDTSRAVSAEEVGWIVRRVATAPFN